MLNGVEKERVLKVGICLSVAHIRHTPPYTIMLLPK